MAERKIAPTASLAEFTEAYEKIAREAGLSEGFFTPELEASLYGIYENLLDASHRFNLTAITDLEGVAERHLVDSLIPIKLLCDFGHLKDSTKLLDIGAGAGFPTLPIGAAAHHGAVPRFTVHAVDSTAKKIGHIKDTAEKLGLSGVTAEAGRAEELAFGKMRESFDIVTARAVSAMPVLIELAAPFVKVGGIFAAMKGNSDEEVAAAARAAKTLGFEAAEVTKYSLPSGDMRSLVIYRKVRRTDTKYPRQYAKITAKPL